MDGLNFLHFDECQVFGWEPSDLERTTLAQKIVETIDAITTGRDGHISDVGGFSIFTDVRRYGAPIISALNSGTYEWTERHLARELLTTSDRVIELGTAVGAVAMTAAVVVGPEHVLTFEANPYILQDAQKNFSYNGLPQIQAKNGIVRNERLFKNDEVADFHISKNFWASRLSVNDTDNDIVETVQVPIFCLEEEVRRHRATVLICDIEGGEVELLSNAKLDGIRMIIMETHYWSAGVSETDLMIRKLVNDGFNIDLAHSAHQVVALRRDLAEPLNSADDPTKYRQSRNAALPDTVP